MSDQISFNPDQVAAQPSGEPIQAGGVGQEQQYVTRADFDALRDEMKRTVQSMSDKQESRLRKEFERQLAERQKAYSELGMTMPEAEKTEIARRVMDSLPADGNRPGQGGPSQEQVESVNRQAADILKGAGISWDDMTLREVNSLKQTTPEAYLESVRQAAASAAKRLGVAAPQQPPNMATAPIIGSGAASGDRLTDITNRMIELQKSPVKNAVELRKLAKEQEGLLRQNR